MGKVRKQRKGKTEEERQELRGKVRKKRNGKESRER